MGAGHTRQLAEEPRVPLAAAPLPVLAVFCPKPTHAPARKEESSKKCNKHEPLTAVNIDVLSQNTQTSIVVAFSLSTGRALLLTNTRWVRAEHTTPLVRYVAAPCRIDGLYRFPWMFTPAEIDTWGDPGAGASLRIEAIVHRARICFTTARVPRNHGVVERARCLGF